MGTLALSYPVKRVALSREMDLRMQRGMDIGKLFPRDIRANFETDSDLRLTQISSYFVTIYDGVISKTGVVVKA